MSKRLQILFPEGQYAKVRRQAKQSRLFLGKWVCSALRHIADVESARSPDDKLRVLEQAMAYGAPIDDVEIIKKQIESGYLK